MPDRPNRRGPAAALATLVMLCFAVLGPWPTAASAAPTAAARFADQVIDGVDIDAVVADLADDHLYGVEADDPTRADLLAQIARANDSSIDLYLVVLSTDLADGEPSEVVGAVLGQVGGTVLLLSPDWVEAESSTVSATEREKAVQAARGENNNLRSVTAFVDVLVATGFPWSLVVIVGVIVVLLAAVTGGLWERRRRAKRTEAAFGRLTDELAASVGALAPDILYISERISLVPDPDLDQTFSQASSDYNLLRDELSTSPLTDRRQVDVMNTRVSALRATLTGIRSKIDAALGRA